MEIPDEVKLVIKKLEENDCRAYIVGGCVRDFLLARRSLGGVGRGKEPEDWDVATSARPEEIQKIFPKNFYSNKFFTVTVQVDSKKTRLKEPKEDKFSFRPLTDVREIEVTTFRSEAKYTDKRHPDEIKFAKTIEEDLARRDFTVNAIALDIKSKIIDPFGGQKDLKRRIIRAVGNPEERFSEDALRMLRAVRFSAVLDNSWQIEDKTIQAIKKNSSLLKMISKERIRDEFLKIIMSEKAASGVDLLREFGLLKYIIPELEEGYKVGQNKHHIYECYEHSLRSLAYAAKKNFNKHVRLAALLHDVGKPRTKRGQGLGSTFYGHEMVGAKMTAQILNRLKFSKKDIEKIVKLVRYHLFYYNVDEVSESSVRRLVRQAGPENMEELLQVRMADRIGSGVPKAEPYKLRHLKYIIEKVSQDPISARMLKVNGNDIMKILNISSGPKIGQILDVLLGYVLEDPKNNNKEFLEKEVKKLGKLSDEKIEKLVKESKKEREKLETKREAMTKKKYWVT